MTGYPSRADHSRRWEDLAAEIAAAPEPSEDPPPLPADAPRGSLTVLGSGIQGLSFTMDCEAKIRNADRVFYCVSNPPTQVWLRSIRPDAYDLYVFYDDTKPRYHTYIQMSEAMLHPVRQGLDVVSIFYGHPGVFVLSTHRAIEIARREGHDAVMKAGISALDCLCADLGVDPSYPGMQTFEATEALLRRRPLDTSLHMVLWQVGLIGETGYRRLGFINDNFPVLVEYLEEHYGPDHEVTHYIAARFPSFDPTIAVHKIGELSDPRLRPSFTGISTFYIPPKDAALTDIDMAVRLGMAVTGDKPAPRTTLRKTALYGRRELEGVAGFAGFKVPTEFQYQERTRAAEFFIEMTTNPDLEELYRADPARAVAEDSFSGLSDLERTLLVRRDENFVQVAAKGSRVQAAPSEKFVRDLYSTRTLAGALRAQLIAAYRGDSPASAVDSWVDSQSPGAKLEHFGQANARVNASSLLPWTGVYASGDGSFTLAVIGSPTQNAFSSVYFGETLLKHFAFNNSTLSWRADDGNATSGRLEFSMPDATIEGPFVRTVVGQVRPADNAAAIEVTGTEIELDPSPMVVHTGRYRTEISSDASTWSRGPRVTVVPLPARDRPAPAGLMIDEVEVEGAVLDGESVTWDGGALTFHNEGQDLDGRLTDRDGTVTVRGTRDSSWSDAFHGRYSVWRNLSGKWTRGEDVEYDGTMVRLDGVAIDGPVFDGGQLSWTGGGGDVDRGSLQFLTDPATGLARFIGSVWTGDDMDSTANVLGTAWAPTAGTETAAVAENSPISRAAWETIASIGSESANPAAYFLWSRISRAREVSRFVNRLALDIIANLE